MSAPSKVARVSAAVLLSLGASSACGITGSDDLPTHADVEVTVTGSSPVQLVLSDYFFINSDGSIALIESDTIDFTSHYEQGIPLRQRPSLYAKVTSSEDDNEIAMKVWLDGAVKYDATQTLQTDEYLEYSYAYTGP